MPDTWGGDFWSRPRLTGSWGGVRDELGKKGVVLNIDLILTPQAVLSGGRDTGAEFWGNAEYTLNVDTGKLGLWPGGFLKVVASSSFGESVLADSGAVVPVNTFLLYPDPNQPSTGLMHATFTQFLSPKFGLVAGKIFTLDAGAGEFTSNCLRAVPEHGAGPADELRPRADLGVPEAASSSCLGGVILSALVLDPSGDGHEQRRDRRVRRWRDGRGLGAGGHHSLRPPGHSAGGGHERDRERLSLTQDPTNLGRFLLTERFPRLGDPGPVLRRILERFFPELLVPVQPANRKDSTWAMFYGLRRLLLAPKGAIARGASGSSYKFGASDGEVNPVKYSYSMGIGGKGAIPGRPRDTFGIGWARTEFSGTFLVLLRQQLRLGLEREDAIEMYYSASITPWLNVTADLQIVEPTLTKNLELVGTTRGHGHRRGGGPAPPGAVLMVGAVTHELTRAAP